MCCVVIPKHGLPHVLTNWGGKASCLSLAFRNILLIQGLLAFHCAAHAANPNHDQCMLWSQITADHRFSQTGAANPHVSLFSFAHLVDSGVSCLSLCCAHCRSKARPMEHLVDSGCSCLLLQRPVQHFPLRLRHQGAGAAALPSALRVSAPAAAPAGPAEGRTAGQGGWCGDDGTGQGQQQGEAGPGRRAHGGGRNWGGGGREASYTPV